MICLVTLICQFSAPATFEIFTTGIEVKKKNEQGKKGTEKLKGSFNAFLLKCIFPLFSKWSEFVCIHLCYMNILVCSCVWQSAKQQRFLGVYSSLCSSLLFPWLLDICFSLLLFLQHGYSTAHICTIFLQEKQWIVSVFISWEFQRFLLKAQQ